MMEIIETGQGNEVLQPKTGDVVNQYLSGCTGISWLPRSVADLNRSAGNSSGRTSGGETYSTHRPRLVLYRVEFDQDGLIARLPFFQLTEYGASQPASGNIEAIHPKIPIARNLSRISLTSSLLAFGSDCNAKRLENPSAIASGFQKRRFDETPSPLQEVLLLSMDPRSASRKARILVIATQSSVLQGADKPSRTQHQSGARGNIPLVLGR